MRLKAFIVALVAIVAIAVAENLPAVPDPSIEQVDKNSHDKKESQVLYDKHHNGGHKKHQCLYVGDDSTVMSWTDDGTYRGPFTQTADAGLNSIVGTRGLQWGAHSKKLYVANGNIEVQCLTGSVLRFGSKGAFENAVLNPAFTNQESDCAEYLGTCSSTATALATSLGVVNPHAPYQPSGMVVDEHNGMLYVADFAGTTEFAGKLSAYSLDVECGSTKWLYDFSIDQALFNHTFHPRGMARPTPTDPYLYVSARALPDALPGWILKFSIPKRKLVEVFVSYDTCNCPLHRPDGLAFDSHGVLHVASFLDGTIEPPSPDGILAFSTSGKYLADKSVTLWDPAKDERVYAQGVAFDDDDNLYTGLTRGPATTAGDIRKYPPPYNSNHFEVFAKGDENGQTGAQAPWYLMWGPC